MEQLKDVKDLGPLLPSGLPLSFILLSLAPYEVPRMAALIPDLIFSYHISSFSGSGEISLSRKPQHAVPTPHHRQGEWDAPIGLSQDAPPGSLCESVPAQRSWLKLRGIYSCHLMPFNKLAKLSGIKQPLCLVIPWAGIRAALLLSQGVIPGLRFSGGSTKARGSVKASLAHLSVGHFLVGGSQLSSGASLVKAARLLELCPRYSCESFLCILLVKTPPPRSQGRANRPHSLMGGACCKALVGLQTVSQGDAEVGGSLCHGCCDNLAGQQPWRQWWCQT